MFSMKPSIFIVIILFGFVSSKTIRYYEQTTKTASTPEVRESYQGYDDWKPTVSSFTSTSVIPTTNLGESLSRVDVSLPAVPNPIENLFSTFTEVDTNGYSAGSGLRSTAQGSADKAISIINKQHAAGVQAAYVAQSTLAQSAVQAAATANAAFAGKEVLWQHLEKQGLEAVRRLDEEISQLEVAKRTAANARQSAAVAASHVAALTAALNNAQQLSENAERAAKDAEAELANQTAMVGESQEKLNFIVGKLAAVQIDFEATKKAASKATASAEEAQRNAEAAGIYASAKLHEVATSTI